MKAVILAGGKGQRMGALTLSKPKPLIKVRGKELILHTLDALPETIKEYVVVTGQHSEQIVSFLGSAYKARPIVYAKQQSAGTGGALQSAKNFLLNDTLFLVVGSDDIFDSKELSTLPTYRPTYAITYGTPTVPTATGIYFDEDMILRGRYSVTENEARYFGTGLYILPPQVFEHPFPILENGEYSIPHLLHLLPFPVYVHQISKWLPVNTPNELEQAETELSKESK